MNSGQEEVLWRVWEILETLSNHNGSANDKSLENLSSSYLHYFAIIPVGHFRVAVNLIMKATLRAKAFHMKISLVCI